MLSFRDYLDQELNRSTDNKVASVSIYKAPASVDTIEDVVNGCNPDTWTARELNGIKYLIYAGRYVNVTELVMKIRQKYLENGYENYGFSKLSEHDMVRYTKTKDILMKAFNSDMSDELDTSNLAQTFFDRELKEFSRKEEIYR